MNASTAPGSIKRALLSVFDKNGLIELAQGLAAHGVELLASGGTGRTLGEAGVPFVEVSAYTKAPEVLGGRVKTLHPKIHAGILADRRHPEHLNQLDEIGAQPIDLVVCNLYPFEEKLRAGADRATMIETIDIGGPTLVRAAAKNVEGGVSVLCDPSDYPSFLDALRETQQISVNHRYKLAARAFSVIAAYDQLIAQWSERELRDPAVGEPSLANTVTFQKLPVDLRYGENPHQKAGLYAESGVTGGLGSGQQLSGKALSYNNYLDMDAAYRAALWQPSGARCAIIKHTNPCGIADRTSQAEAFRAALAGDPVSAFGSILGFNRPVEKTTAEAIREAKLFVECIVAPDFEPSAQALLAEKANLRLYRVPRSENSAEDWAAHRIQGGLLIQQADQHLAPSSEWRCVTRRSPTETEREELRFAMTVAAILKSNAIALTQDQALVGMGCGQTSRVDAAQQAIAKAGEKAHGSVMGSDAFFPFDDCVRLAAQAGVVAIAQPGGSKRDEESIAACDELGLAMVFTGRRHFRH